MATQCRHARGFQARRATADHRHMLRGCNRRDDALAFMAGLRVDRAFDPLVDKDLADTYIAVNARSNRLQLTSLQLVGQLWVGQQLAAHGDEITLAGGNRGVAGFWFDTPDGNNRNAHALLDGRCPFEKSPGLLHQRRFGKGHAATGHGVGRDTDCIGAGALSQAGNRLGIVEGDATGGEQFFCIQPQPDAKAGANPRAYGRQDLKQQARTVFHCATVCIFTAVVIRR
ncbi:hypothetical protein D3C81_1558740 [compost metagenome]